MLSYALVENKPRILKSLTGLSKSEFEALLPSFQSAERPIARPKDKALQQEYYSGKKKTHRVNNNGISHRGGKVVYLSETYEGTVHDKLICDLEGYEFPDGSKLWQDRGYQGYAPEGVVTLQPKKKPKGGELSEADKERNREISRERVEFKHQINGIKRSRIVSHRLRSRTDHYADDVMETACGLHN